MTIPVNVEGLPDVFVSHQLRRHPRNNIAAIYEATTLNISQRGNKFGITDARRTDCTQEIWLLRTCQQRRKSRTETVSREQYFAFDGPECGIKLRPDFTEGLGESLMHLTSIFPRYQNSVGIVP